mgnify:FL=1
MFPYPETSRQESGMRRSMLFCRIYVLIERNNSAPMRPLREKYGIRSDRKKENIRRVRRPRLIPTDKILLSSKIRQNVKNQSNKASSDGKSNGKVKPNKQYPRKSAKITCRVPEDTDTEKTMRKTVRNNKIKTMIRLIKPWDDGGRKMTAGFTITIME